MPCAIHRDVVAGLSTCTRCGGQFCPDCVISLGGKIVCARCKGSHVQDIRSGTTEDIVLAGRWARLGAQIIDGIILNLSYAAFIFACGMPLNGTGMSWPETILWHGVFPVILGTIYEGLLLSSMKGQTPGKKLLKVRVVQADGGDLSTGRCWGRSLATCLMQVTYILGLIDALMIFSKERTTLHDRIVKSRVIKVD